MRNTIVTSVVTALLLGFGTGHSFAAEPNLPFEKYTLPNGLEVILSPDPRVPVVHVQVWYHVGSKDEQVGRTGFAHLFEHMMFQGSRDIAEDTWFKKLDAVGASGINGTTNTERTNYFESVPAHQLALALWMEADRMGFLLDSVNEKAFKNQQDVVRNERRQSYEMRPYGMAHKASVEALYPKSHPYHHTTIGEHEDLELASLENVKQFFRTYYVPSNATLAIVGSFDPKEVKALVEKYFGTLPGGKSPARPKVTLPTAPVIPEVAMEANVQLPRFDYIWHGPVPFGADEAELDLLGMMLANGKSSRLYKRLVYDAKIAQSVAAELDSREYGGEFDIDVTMKPDHNIAEGRKLVDEELARLATAPFTEEELSRAKTKFEANFIRELETNQGRAGMLQTANHYTHDPARMRGELARYRAVTLLQIQAATKRWLGHPKLLLTIVPNKDAPLGGRVIGAVAVAALPPINKVVPETNAQVKREVKLEQVADSEAWRKDPPQGTTPKDIELPAPKIGKLSNGLPVIVVERRGLPIVEAYLQVYAGAERVPAAKAGLADLTAGLLTEGTTKHDALALGDALDSIGARLNAGASYDVAFVSLSALSARLDPALDLFAEVVMSPAFTEKDFERVRDQRMTALLQQKDQPAAIAYNTASRVVFGDGHPYAWPLLGSESTLKSFGRKDVIDFYQNYYGPKNAQLIVVGDTSLDEICQKLEARLRTWQSKAIARAVPPRAPAASKLARKLFLVDQPQASQSVISLAHVGVTRGNPDYVPLVVANYILGGSFSSRINMNLREKNGYSYGARSQFQFLRGPGLFSAGGSVRGNVTKEALTELFKEVTGFRAANVTTEELSETKASLIGKMPFRFETNGGIAGALAELLRNDLPLDWYATFVKKVSAVSAVDVQRVAKKYLTPDKAQVIVVGDRKSIEESLKSLKLGEIEIRGHFGEPL